MQAPRRSGDFQSLRSACTEARPGSDAALPASVDASNLAGMTQPLPILYVKSGCPWCDEVLEFLDSRGIACQKVTVSGDREAMQAMTDLSGQSKAPTMDWHGEILADFGVDELVPFLKERGVI